MSVGGSNASGEPDEVDDTGFVADTAEADAEPMAGDGLSELSDARATNSAAGGASAGALGGVSNEFNTQAFEELRLPLPVVQAVQETWELFVSACGGRAAAGEAIYGVVFESAPTMQSLFKTPRAVQSMRFAFGVLNLVSKLSDPPGLKSTVEVLSFQHLAIEVTIQRVVVFRDAMLELMAMELGDRITAEAVQGWSALFNYVGGAFIYVRTEFAGRLNILTSSWAAANNKRETNEDGEEMDQGEGESHEHAVRAATSSKALAEAGTPKTAKVPSRRSWRTLLRGARAGSPTSVVAERREKTPRSSSPDGSSNQERRGGSSSSSSSMHVPKTFNEMFQFNAAVMGLSGNLWMREVLASFDNIVTHVANSHRFQEECDVLTLRIGRLPASSVNLKEFKAVMLASLRSLLPKEWNSEYEVAWTWLWNSVEKLLAANLGKPPVQERYLRGFYASLDAEQLDRFRTSVYTTFFSKCAAGQHYFKQSTTRLHFIADKIVSLTADIFSDPNSVVEDISALGLRHVGYGVPTDLFGPFVTAAIEVMTNMTTVHREPGVVPRHVPCPVDSTHTVPEDELPGHLALEAFRWSLGLVARVLIRTINEGSTVVMKAINANSARQLRDAVALAPRGERAKWMLRVQVGSQSISPLMWAVESGSQEAAKAIIADLLTIRADRDNYYYAVDDLFHRHPDIMRRLCVDAPSLLPTLLDGLVWRSRSTEGGLRRVNYYVRHLIVDVEGGFSRSLRQIIQHADPALVCHPVVTLSLDLVWGRLASHMFLWGKSWFILNMAVFVLCQSILERLHGGETTPEEDIVILICRIFIYTLCLGQLVVRNAKLSISAYRSGEVRRDLRVPLPSYLFSMHEVVGLLLILAILIMFALDPLLHCSSNNEGRLFYRGCQEGEKVRLTFSIFSTAAVMLYFILAIDLSVFSTKVSAFVLVCQRMFSEMAMFIGALASLLLAFSCGVSALDQDHPEFQHIPEAALSLLRLFLGMFSEHSAEDLEREPLLMIACVVFFITSWVFMLNVLVAQLCCAYRSTFQDMVGMARLRRGRIVIETMPSVSPQRWEHFVEALDLDKRLEFNEGDIGLAGGIQMLEPAAANPVTTEQIRRFGGSTSPELPWPEAASATVAPGEEHDKFERMEKMLSKALKRMVGGGGRRGGSSAGSYVGGSSSASSASRSDDGHGG